MGPVSVLLLLNHTKRSHKDVYLPLHMEQTAQIIQFFDKLRMHFAHHSLFTHTACSCGNLRQVTQVSFFFFWKGHFFHCLHTPHLHDCTCMYMYNGLCETSTQFFNTITYCSYHLPFSFSASMKACKTFSLISEVLQNPSSAGRGRDVLLALFLSKNYKVLHHSVQYFK